MPDAGPIFFALLVLAGHAALCVMTFNRLNASGVRWLKSSEKILLVVLVLPAPYVCWQLIFANIENPWWFTGYCMLCVVCLISRIPGWILQRMRTKPAAFMKHQQRELPEQQLEGARLERFWRMIPGNQAGRLVVEQKSLWIPRLPPALSGFTITHLSDLHFTGRVSKSYFETVVEQANALDSQLIAITGDFIDQRRCLPWLADVLGMLKAELGVYFVLGNHDQRIGESIVRGHLERAGLVSLGGGTAELNIDGNKILLAGDERPWFEGPADAEVSNGEDYPLRMLLAHTPDRYQWARNMAFDVMLAGHTHGGQVRLPMIGAVLSPSRYGTWYASGVFDESPTVMHVSRGVSSQQPWRWSCPPEITQLTLLPEPAFPSREHEKADEKAEIATLPVAAGRSRPVHSPTEA